jgi:integrase
MTLGYINELLTREEFFKKIYNKSKSIDSEGNAKSYLATLDHYSKDKYGLETGQIMADLRLDVKSTNSQAKVFRYLNDYVEWLLENHPNIIIKRGKNKSALTYLKAKNANSITAYFSMARRYLKLCGGIRINDDDIRDYITFPRSITDDEEAQPLTPEIARDVISRTRDQKRVTLYYFMKDTGFRISEAGSTQKKHIHLETKPPSVFLPKANSKGKVASSWVYLTNETAKRIVILIKNLDDQDYPFKRYNEQPLKQFRENELEVLRIVYKKIGLNERYSHNNRYKFNIHSWRAFCATQYAKNTSEEAAHGYIRHKKYLQQYIRKTDSEKIQLFERASFDLTLDESARKQVELDIIRREKFELEKQKHDIEEMKEEINRIKLQNDISNLLKEKLIDWAENNHDKMTSLQAVKMDFTASENFGKLVEHYLKGHHGDLAELKERIDKSQIRTIQN